MREPQFIVARSRILDQHAPGGASAFAGVVSSAWPRACAPSVGETLTIEGLIELLGALQQPGQQACSTGGVCVELDAQTPVVVVCWHGSESMARVAQIADHLLRLRIPAVFAVQRCDESWRRFEASGLLVEPMDTHPSRLASMLHAMCSHSMVVTEMREELRASVASQGGITGQINRLHEELNLASTIQRSLMPPLPPQIEDLEMAVLFRPAAYVSGDLFNLIPLDGGRLAFLLADAVGHGVPAALLTMLIHRAVTETRLGAAGDASPAETIKAINSALASACPGGSDGTRFATAVFGIFDPRTHEVSLSVAGHPPPLRMSADRTTPIHSHGPLLGVFEEAQFDEESFTLEPGETLLLYSDGFEVAFPMTGETSPANEEYLRHFARFSEGVEKCDGVRAPLAELEAELDVQRGSLNQADDITAIALRRPRATARSAKAA